MPVAGIMSRNMAMRNETQKDKKAHSEPNPREGQREDMTRSTSVGDRGWFIFSSVQIAVTGILSAVYVTTMHRSLPGGDAGES